VPIGGSAGSDGDLADTGAAPAGGLIAASLILMLGSALLLSQRRRRVSADS
jgi:LPXTG-motif cell wall-anchored protein